MMRAAKLVACAVALVGSLAASAPARADQRPSDLYSLADVVSKTTTSGDPTWPAPAFNPADYEVYRRGGPGAIVGDPFVTLRDGETFRCVNGLEVAVLPKTPYVEWMIDKYFHTLARVSWSIDPAANVNGPRELQFYARDSIVRFGECNNNGYFIVNNLAPGHYIAVATIRVPTSGVRKDYSQDAVMMPDGEIGTVFHNGVVATSGFGEGWVLFGGTFTILPSGGTVTAPDQAWSTAAHVHAGSPSVAEARALGIPQ